MSLKQKNIEKENRIQEMPESFLFLYINSHSYIHFTFIEICFTSEDTAVTSDPVGL